MRNQRKKKLQFYVPSLILRREPIVDNETPRIAYKYVVIPDNIKESNNKNKIKKKKYELRYLG